MPLTEADREAARKRKLDQVAEATPNSVSQQMPQQSQNAHAGTQQTNDPSSAHPSKPAKTPADPTPR